MLPQSAHNVGPVAQKNGPFACSRFHLWLEAPISQSKGRQNQ